MGVEEVCSALNWKKIQNGSGAVNGGPFFHVFLLQRRKEVAKEENMERQSRDYWS